MMKKLMLWFVLLLTACTSTEPTKLPVLEPTEIPTSPKPTEVPPVTEPWWNDTVFYELFVRSFYDSDGDGTGDINGLIKRLDYLNDGDPATTDDLGITGLWLMPIMESPSYHGYDVVDYYQVDQEYGDNEVFREFINEAHTRGIRVIVDLVLNHTSRQHPWFQEANHPDSLQRDWYIWVDQSLDYSGPWGQRVWHRGRGGFYYALFWDGMPDLNLENPEVTAQMYDATRFWLEEMGVDGFRLDAVKHLIEDGAIQENTPETHEWLGGFYTFYKGVAPDAFTVGEAWTSTSEVLEYTGDEVDMAFQFDLAQDILGSVTTGLGSLYVEEMASIISTYPPGQYGTFITNHDQNRVLSQLNGDINAAKVAGSILLTSPGVPFIYYGEEIGMLGVKPDEDIRRPMQWSAENQGAGFTDGRPWRPPYKDYETRNVAEQKDDPDSLLNHYRSLINLRNNHEALRIGDWALVETGSDQLIAFMRSAETESLLVLINPDRNTVQDYELSLQTGPLQSGSEIQLLFGSGSLTPPIINDEGGFIGYAPFEFLPPQSTFILAFN